MEAELEGTIQKGRSCGMNKDEESYIDGVWNKEAGYEWLTEIQITLEFQSDTKQLERIL